MQRRGEFRNVSKILLIGAGPLPEPQSRMPAAAALRTWQFARALQEAGHAVEVIVLPAEGTASGGAIVSTGSSLVSSKRIGSLNCSTINSLQFQRALGAIQEIHNRKKHEALIAVGITASALASRLASTIPMWFDLGEGPGMAEAQARCRLFGSDDALKTAWARNRSALRRGDRFSAAASRQTYAILGELAALGRLNRFTDGYPFVSTLPHAVPEWVDKQETGAVATGQKTLTYRGRLFPDNAFAILWTGGFQPWVDVRTLVAGLSLAFEQEPDLQFVCAGGPLSGVDEATYPTFATELGRTGFADRCHLLGWTTASEVLTLMNECNLGLVVDEPGYATALDSRARITAWMGAGLPIMTTSGSEIAETLQEHEFAYVVRMGRVQELADTLAKAMAQGKQRREMATRAQKFAREHLSYENTTRALIRWAGAPSLAPDNAEKKRRDPEVSVFGQTAINPLELEALQAERNIADEYARLKAEMDALNRNLLVQMIRKLRSNR